MDPIHTSQSSQNDKPIKRSKLHRLFDFIISLVLVTILIFMASGVIFGVLNSFGFAMLLLVLLFGVFPLLAILSFLTLHWELKYIKRNCLPKKELYKAPSFYATLLTVVAFLLYLSIRIFFFVLTIF